VALLVVVASAMLGYPGTGSARSSGAARALSETVIAEQLPGYGTVLATSSGKALFMLTADPPGESKCSGSCTNEWHPLIESGTPTAGPGVKASLLSTFRRDDGQRQVAYDKHALYTHAGSDPAAAAGALGEGGIWYLVSPAGTGIGQTTSGGY
jgi:predicted lipoprotein with Yx(FWY)xxD motif